MKLETARGVRDIFPQEQVVRNKIMSIMQSLFQSHGFLPLDTPILERYDVLSAKFAAGEESDAMTETYRLKDNGERELGLRFDLTVPLARFVGMNRTIKMPFKRYQFGKVYRDAPIKAGRFREFTQCDVDIIGSKDMLADATVAQIGIKLYRELGVDVVIQVNNRKILNELITSSGIPSDKADSVLMSIDKLLKLGKKGVLEEEESKGLNSTGISSLLDFFETLKGSNLEKLSLVKQRLPNSQGVEELEEFLSYFTDKEVVYTPVLARGLGYYTGTVFEVYDAQGKLDSSIGGGGRYDKLISGYLESSQEYPAVGLSFGLDRIVYVLNELGINLVETNQADVFIIPLGTKKESFALAEQLREAGLRVDIDLMNRGPSKNMQYADSVGIPFTIVLGENELAKNTINLKELATRNEQELSVNDAIAFIKEKLV